MNNKCKAYIVYIPDCTYGCLLWNWSVSSQTTRVVCSLVFIFINFSASVKFCKTNRYLSKNMILLNHFNWIYKVFEGCGFWYRKRRWWVAWFLEIKEKMLKYIKDNKNSGSFLKTRGKKDNHFLHFDSRMLYYLIAFTPAEFGPVVNEQWFPINQIESLHFNSPKPFSILFKWYVWWSKTQEANSWFNWTPLTIKQNKLNAQFILTSLAPLVCEFEILSCYSNFKYVSYSSSINLIVLTSFVCLSRL